MIVKKGMKAIKEKHNYSLNAKKAINKG